MKQLVVLLLVAGASCFAADTPLRSLLGVSSLAFQVPHMAKESRYEIGLISYVDGVQVGKPSFSTVASLGGNHQMEVLWHKEGPQIKVVFAREGQSMVSTLPSFPENSLSMQESKGKPLFITEDGWSIMGFWSADESLANKPISLDFMTEVKGHKRVLAVALREKK